MVSSNVEHPSVCLLKLNFGDFRLKRKLRIAVNAQVPSGSGAGGIETVLRVLTSLGRLEGDEEYIFIGHWSEAEWLKPLLGERQTIVRAPQPEEHKPNRTETLRRSMGPLRPLIRRVKRLVAAPPKAQTSVPSSDGFYENLNSRPNGFLRRIA